MPSLQTVRPDLDPRLVAWVGGLLEREPGARTPGPARAREQLDELAVGLLGPHWRRNARLPGSTPHDGGLPATPAIGPTAPSPHTQNVAPPQSTQPLAPLPEAPPPGPAAYAPPPQPSRRSTSGLRRVLAAAVVLGAAVAGVAVALAGESDAPSTATTTTATTAKRAQTAYLRDVAAELRTLTTARAAAIRSMRMATTRRGQARSATRVAGAYAAAGRALRALTAPAPLAATATQVRSRIAQTVRDYEALGRAARDGRSEAYTAASGATARDEADLDRLLTKLGLRVDRAST